MIRVGKLLTERTRSVERLVAHSIRLQSVAAALDRALPATLAGHCHLINVRGNQLILQVESPSWATRLRFSLPGILDALRGAVDGELARAHIKIRPAGGVRGSAPSGPPRLSAAAAETVRMAASCTRDPALREAWTRLARHARGGCGS
jgi:hypothetical protein